MRPIRINDDLKVFAKSFSDKLFEDRRSDFVKPVVKLKKLLSKYPQSTNSTERSIIKWIIKNYRGDLLYLSPEQQQLLVNHVDSNYSTCFYVANKKTVFCTDIIDALRYESLRTHYASKIANKLELKTCPYCNAMLVITVNEKKARFQLDHFFPKSKYPFLATSFFNLIPSCANCNQAKSASDVKLGQDFHLYANETPEDAFKFTLDDIEVVKRTIGIKSGDLKILFTHTSNEYEDFVNNHNKSFAIQGIYDTQKDIAEELVWKSQSYTKAKINELQKILNLSENEIKRLIVGNYTVKENIHKRPMSKFMQDIADDLDLI